MKFTKMHGAGNDYIYVNCFEELIEDRPELARLVSDRRFGIGGDGLICICPSEKADFCMDMYNADGSRGQMCGNGIRCVGKYVYDRGMTKKTGITVETPAGIRELELLVTGGNVGAVKVNMGTVSFNPRDIPLDSPVECISKPVVLGGAVFEVTALSVGNPHAVVFVDDTEAVKIAEIGPIFETHPMFPEGVNTEFVQLIDEHTLKMRVWERGSGETLACGTGAVASLAAAHIKGLTGRCANVILPGGELYIEWDKEANTLFMTGPAVTVFDGELYI